MNNRIKELAKQAGYRDIFDNDTKARARLEKYTELIVKECVDVIRKEVSLKYKDGGETEEFMGGHYASSVLARVKIKHHFGVEE